MCTRVQIPVGDVTDLLVLEGQVAVSRLTWELGIEITLFARAVCVVSQ